MLKLSTIALAITLLAAVGTARAQHPILDKVAEKVIQKYQSSTCEQLWASRGKHNEEEKRAVAFLRSDPQMREEFFNRIAGPIVNKMFECGMVP